MMGRELDRVEKVIDFIEGKPRPMPEGLTVDQKVRAAYVLAASKPCCLCHEGAAYVVGKYDVPDGVVSPARVVLYALCFLCFSHPDHKARAEMAMLEALIGAGNG